MRVRMALDAPRASTVMMATAYRSVPALSVPLVAHAIRQTDSAPMLVKVSSAPRASTAWVVLVMVLETATKLAARVANSAVKVSA